MKPSLMLFPLLLLFLHCTNTLSQPPSPSPAAAPAQPPASNHQSYHPKSLPPPPGPTGVIPILLKAGNFTAFVRLIKGTHVDTQLISQLNSSTDGITILAPTDTAFSNIKAGAIGSLKDREKLAFVQFHVLPRFLSISDFQTLSNPVKTLAGSDARYPMTISTSDNSVNISTGLTKTSIVNTVYTDKQVAIYEIDKVLQTKNLFPPAAAPALATTAAESPEVAKDASGAVRSNGLAPIVVLGVGIIASLFSL